MSPPPRCRKADLKVHLSKLRESGFDVPPHLEIKLLGRRLLSLVQQVVSGSDSATAELPIALTPFAKIDGSDNEESGLEGGPSIVSCPAPFDPHAPTMSAMPCYLSKRFSLVQRVVACGAIASTIVDGAESFGALHTACEAIDRACLDALAKLDLVGDSVLGADRAIPELREHSAFLQGPKQQRRDGVGPCRSPDSLECGLH